MKLFPLIKKVFLSLVITSLTMISPPTRAEEKPQIVFAGITFGGSDFPEIKGQFPYLSPAWEKETLTESVKEAMENCSFNFDRIDSTGKGKEKDFEEVEAPLSFTILVTRESLFKDEYRLKIKGEMKTYVKYYFDVGLSAVFFSPAQRKSKGESKDKIEYAIPVIAEDILLGSLTENQKKEQFIQTFNRAVKLLLKKVEKLTPRQVKAQIIDVSGQMAWINAGKSDGILKGINVILPNGGSGTITEVKSDKACISLQNGNAQKGDAVTINICKNEQDETFQVTDVTFSSKQANALLLKDPDFKILCAQWFSDYLSDRTGVIVLPPRKGAAYATLAKAAMISAYKLTGRHYVLDFQVADNPIVLDVNGLSKKMIKGNDINQVWIYKAWVEQNIAGNKKEVSEFVKEEVIVGVKEVNDYQVFREVIQQTLAKLAKN